MTEADWASDKVKELLAPIRYRQHRDGEWDDLCLEAARALRKAKADGMVMAAQMAIDYFSGLERSRFEDAVVRRATEIEHPKATA